MQSFLCNSSTSGAYKLVYGVQYIERRRACSPCVQYMGTRTILQMMHRKSTTLGLEERTERVLAYMFFWISGIFFLFFEKNRNVRWHALQSTLVFGGLSLCMFAVSVLRTILSIIFSTIPILGGVLV